MKIAVLYTAEGKRAPKPLAGLTPFCGVVCARKVGGLLKVSLSSYCERALCGIWVEERGESCVSELSGVRWACGTEGF